MVIPSMVRRALREEPILVYGDGGQSRCFSAVSDVVRGTLLLADSATAIRDSCDQMGLHHRLPHTAIN